MLTIVRAAIRAGCAAALAAAAPASAEEDAQLWGAVVANGAVRGDLFVWLEAQLRLTDEIGGGSQILARPAIGARIGRDAHAVIGYAYVRTDPRTGATTRENRLWQQIQFAPLRTRAGAPLVVSRTRLEQRRLEDRADTGWRLRQLVRVQAPIARGGAIQAIVYTEGFLNLNGTAWGARAGIDQWRNFAGVGVPLADGIRIEPGYLNQRVARPGPDRSNHILNATLTIALR